MGNISKQLSSNCDLGGRGKHERIFFDCIFVEISTERKAESKKIKSEYGKTSFSLFLTRWLTLFFCTGVTLSHHVPECTHKQMKIVSLLTSLDSTENMKGIVGR